MIDEKYILLIHNHLRGNLSETDQLILQNWLDQHADHRRVLQDMEKAWQVSQMYQADYAPDVELGLQKLQKRIQVDQDTDSHRQLVPKRPTLRVSYAIAAGLLCLVTTFAVWNFWFRLPDILMVATGPGQQKYIALDDGSNVVLNENSSLSYPSFFRGGRQVQLSGEAYFEISRDENNSFEVTTRTTQTKVLGTSFNLRAYEDEAFTEVEVLEGVVRLADIAGKQTLELNQGTRGIYEHQMDTVRADQPKTLNATFWKDHRLRFKGHRLPEAIQEINTRLNIRIQWEDQAITSCSFSGSIPLSHPDTLIAILAGNFGATWQRIAEGDYTISGGSCEQ